ncbi:MAG TPA: lysophospholipid acyltransferase family protein [Rudaea sp.]
MNDARLPVIPPLMPRRTSWFSPICRWLFLRSGWRFAGELPNVPKLVAIAAPHSSNWDVVVGLLFKLGLGIDVHFVGKKEAFFWPLGPILRALGGIAIDRKSPKGIVGEMDALFDERERFWLAIAPEGTRKKVDKWKSGFWRVAREAGVPILPAYFHYPAKTIGVGPLFYPTGDMAADVAKIREFYRPWQGKNGKTA